MIYLIFIISFLCHELGHIIVGRIFGYKIKNMKFFIFGGFIEFETIKEIRYKTIKKIIIFSVGPLVNFSLAMLCLIKKDFLFKEEIFYSNIVLFIFNLIPIKPLDGSRILFEFINLFFKGIKGEIYFYKINKMCLIVLTLWYSVFILILKNLTLVFIIFYLWYIDYKEYEKIKIYKNCYEVMKKVKI